MELKTITLGLLAIGASAGAAATLYPSAFAGAFGAERVDFLAPQPVDLNESTVRSRIANMSARSAVQSFESRYGGQSLAPVESSTTVKDDGVVAMKVTLAGDHVIDFNVVVEPVTGSRSTVDVSAHFNYDWLSDTGEVIPGDLARMEAAAEVLATEYVLSQLQQRPLLTSDEDFIQVYGRRAYDRLEDRIGQADDTKRRIETAIASKYSRHLDSKSGRGTRSSDGAWSQNAYGNGNWGD